MFHFSTDRLAGLDTMILRITTSQKVSTLIPNPSGQGDSYTTLRKLRKQKPLQETRTPLADKTASTNLDHRPPNPTSSMLLHAPFTTGEVGLLSPTDATSRVSCSPDVPSFRPLPPLPSASTLQLPSFLNFSSQSFPSLADPPPHFPTPSLFRVSSSVVTSSRRTVVRKTKNNKVLEGPQWIPAFHHPNSPYVPWSEPVRRRILPPSSPLPVTPVCPSPIIRSGAVAPEPWASSIFSQPLEKSRRDRLSSSWKSFRDSIKKGVKTVVSRLGKSRKSIRTLCTGQDMLHTYDDAFIESGWTSDVAHSGRDPHDSLASFVSSDFKTLATWLAERRVNDICDADNFPKEISVEEYELTGSWLDLRLCEDGGWVCGVQDCGMHTAGGSPYVTGEYPDGLRMAMPFDSAQLLSVTYPAPTEPAARPSPKSLPASPRSQSLPRLPGQYFDVHSTQEAKPAKITERCLPRYRELSMPGGWTFTR
ncbi:hypothetical protein JVU11DRAFT_5324 [Chiua virens]|nr:hypothetical protein JVU11DRAFT_5324 [Chiua virens]